MAAMKPVRSPMFTARTDVDMAVGLAFAEELAGHIVSVCCVCITDRMRTALLMLRNVSHGLCPGCLAAQLRELGEDADLPVASAMDAVPNYSGAKMAFHRLPDCPAAGAKHFDGDIGRRGDLERRGS